MKKAKRKLSNLTLSAFALLLAALLAALIYADVLLGKFYGMQKAEAHSAAAATPVPVLKPGATPAAPASEQPAAAASPAPTASPTPVPPRTAKTGDIEGVNFPSYDTGVNADYSYQSDELRIAVTRVEDTGVTYYVADIWMRNINCYRTAFANGKFLGKRQDAETISQNNNAILGVNGDFLGGLVIRNGILYREATERLIELPDDSAPTPTPAESGSGSGNSGLGGGLSGPAPTEQFEPEGTPRPERATCVLYGDGRIVTEEFLTFSSPKAMRKGAWQGWQFGPTLVRNGKAAKDVNKQGRNPRAMLGYYEPGHYCIVVIDGRQKGYSIGMNFHEMMALAMSLGLKEAYNLDGGGSAVMTFNGKVINRPSDGGVRNLPDMIVIGEYPMEDAPLPEGTASAEGQP